MGLTFPKANSYLSESVLAYLSICANMLDSCYVNAYNNTSPFITTEVGVTVHDHEEIRSAFSDKPLFTRGEFHDYMMTNKPALKENSIGWLLYELCQKHVIERVAHNAYRVYTGNNPLVDYAPVFSGYATDILEFLRVRFPLLTFIVWETRLFNEFANHQLARNFIFVESEKLFCESVFNAIYEKGGHTILYKPNEKEIAMYSGDITVSVIPLISEAPIDACHAKLEKMLVDLFANKLLDRIISTSEFPGIYEEAFSKYNINYNMMLRYAKRRSKADEIRSFIENKTDITVLGKDALND